MDMHLVQNRFDQAVSSLSPRLRELLLQAPRSAKQTATEIRLRVGRPIAITCPEKIWFVDDASQLHNIPVTSCLVTRADIEESIVSMCAHSVHAHQQEFREGFISLRGGHRAGICGTAVLGGEGITAVREITSINLRVAREVPGAANDIIEQVFAHGLQGLLIAGVPASGKTTVLRDLARQLAGGRAGRFWKVAVVDERCEIGAVHDGEPQNDLGCCCDVLSGYPKAAGMRVAVRTLSPDVVICDEVGGPEADAMLDCLNCGVRVVATAHAQSAAELLCRPYIMKLLDSGAFQKIVLLDGPDNPGEIKKVLEVGELLAQNGRDGAARTLLISDGRIHGGRIIGTGIEP